MKIAVGLLLMVAISLSAVSFFRVSQSFEPGGLGGPPPVSNYIIDTVATTAANTLNDVGNGGIDSDQPKIRTTSNFPVVADVEARKRVEELEYENKVLKRMLAELKTPKLGRGPTAVDPTIADDSVDDIEGGDPISDPPSLTPAKIANLQEKFVEGSQDLELGRNILTKVDGAISRGVFASGGIDGNTEELVLDGGVDCRGRICKLAILSGSEAAIQNFLNGLGPVVGGNFSVDGFRDESYTSGFRIQLFMSIDDV